MRDYIIADNQYISKAGITYLLTTLKEVIPIAEVADKAELIQALKERSEAVVILDYTLFDFSGSEELGILKERFPKVNWLLFSEQLSEEFLRRMLLTGQAFSVVMKECSREEILTALQCTLRGERFICNSVGNLLLGGHHAPPPQDTILTHSERAILKEIAQGKSTKEIAAARNLSFHTINTHRKNIFRKIEVNNVHEATKYAMRAGLVDLAEYYI